ncbi:MAG: PQQ-binding-like beta-propeller repeat protein [Tepidisphaerales bacterium]
MNRRTLIAAAVLGISWIVPVFADDWPMWGRDASRNMVAPDTERNLPTACTPGKIKDETLDLSGARGIRWAARLGSSTYGNPTIAGGRILVGTNNEPPKDERIKDDRGVVLCLDEKTGKFLWQLAEPKLAGGKHVDYDNIGICSSPAIENGRAWLVSNRCEVVCLDMAGQDGQAKVLWRFDMRDELGVFPHQATSGAVLVFGDRVYASTSNGADWSLNKHIPAPHAPALVCLDKNTGKLLGVERSGISSRTYTCNWGSPSVAMVGGKPQIIFGGDDGFCYAFDPDPRNGVLKEIWRCDANSPERRKHKYGSPQGPCGILATPVFANGRVYVAIGRDPEDGSGDGTLVCIDPTGTGDVTAGKRVWIFEGIEKSLSTVAVKDALLFAADFAGFVYCLEADTGKLLWKYDTQGQIWGSPLLADGKLYIATQGGGDLFCLAAAREKKELGKTSLDGAIVSTPIVANGVLYIATEKYLYAIDGK